MSFLLEAWSLQGCGVRVPLCCLSIPVAEPSRGPGHPPPLRYLPGQGSGAAFEGKGGALAGPPWTLPSTHAGHSCVLGVPNPRAVICSRGEWN